MVEQRRRLGRTLGRGHRGRLLAALLLPTSASAQQSSCADCHYANPTAPAPQHLSDWELSAHGRNRVGCEKCHGGDASTLRIVSGSQGHPAELQSRQPGPSPQSCRHVRELSCGPVRAVPEQPAFQAAGERRQQGADLHHVPRRGRFATPLSQDAGSRLSAVPRPQGASRHVSNVPPRRGRCSKKCASRASCSERPDHSSIG